jgi:peptidoglycan hydrolase-like protein with peptidoglycan-binding domain
VQKYAWVVRTGAKEKALNTILSAALLAIVVAASGEALADDLTRTIQQDLQALGYEPGNTDGEATTQTAVAISQFQAENNLEVTGEPSPTLAGMIKAKLKGGGEAAAPSAAAAAAPAPDPAALHAAQQACLQQKMADRQKSDKTKRGLGSLMRAVGRTVSRIGGDTAYDIARTTNDIYGANATAADLQSAAEDLGLAESDLEECRNPPMSAAATPAGNPNPVVAAGASPMGGMPMGMKTLPAQTDKNVKLPDSYRFSYRTSISIKNSKGVVEPVFYLQPDAPYYARKQARDGLTEYLVLDNQNNMAVIFAELDGRKGRMHSPVSLKTKATLMGAFRDAPAKEPAKEIESKTILGYHSKGYQISTEAGTTRLWITDEAPASLFSTQFAQRAGNPGSPVGSNSMIMEVSFVSADSPEKSYEMVCTGLQPESLVLSKSDYQEAL